MPQKLRLQEDESMAVPQDLIREIHRLEPLPVTVQRLMVMLGEETLSPKEVASAIEYDQVLVPNLLRVANSPLVGSRATIGRVADAVMILGVDVVFEIALGTHFKTIVQPVEMYDLTENELWLHGATASVAVKEIAATCSTTEIPSLASVAALIHDVGKLVLVRHVDADMHQVLRVAREGEMTFVEAERELFGFDHAEVGGVMAEKWSLPEEVRDAVARHHQVLLDDSNPLLDTVVMANWVAKTVGVGLGAEGLNFGVDPGVAKRLGFRYPEFARVCSRVADLMDDLKKAHGMGESN
jgi:putative nucleotidyltransferase with HDIG domain